MSSAFLELLPAPLRARRDVLDARDRWAAATLLARDEAAAVVVTEWPAGPIAWALGDTGPLDRLVPDALRRLGRSLRWASVPRAVHVPHDALAAVGLERRTSWDRLTTDVPPAPQVGEDGVVALDAERDVEAIGACLDVANPTTQARPGAPGDAGWWGVRGVDSSLVGVIGVTAQAGAPSPTMHLHGLAVVPAARGRGIGAALAATATRRALAGGAPWVSLGMFEDNVHARRVYTALGFRVDVEVAGYGPPGVLHP